MWSFLSSVTTEINDAANSFYLDDKNDESNKENVEINNEEMKNEIKEEKSIIINPIENKEDILKQKIIELEVFIIILKKLLNTTEKYYKEKLIHQCITTNNLQKKIDLLSVLNY